MHTLDLSDHLSSAIGSPRDQHALAQRVPREKPPYALLKILCGFKIKFIVNNQIKAASGSKKRSLKTVSASIGIHLSSINQLLLMAEGRQNQKPKQRRNDSYAIKPSKDTGNDGRLSRKEIIDKNKDRDKLEKDYPTDFKQQIQQERCSKMQINCCQIPRRMVLCTQNIFRRAMWHITNNQGMNAKLDSVGKFATDANNSMDVFGKELFQHVFLLALFLPVKSKAAY